jgi:hypothetical protein
MRTSQRWMAAIGLAFWLMPVMGGAQPDGKMAERGLLTDTEAVLMLPPEIAIGPMVRRSRWSPDGRYVLAVRETMRITPEMLRALMSGRPESMKEPPGEVSLVLWSSRERRADTLLRAPLGVGRVEEIEWMPGSGAALAVVVQPGVPTPQDPKPEPRRRILRLDAESGRARVVAEMLERDITSIAVSPTQPLAVIWNMAFREVIVPQPDGATKVETPGEIRVYVLGEEGRLGQPSIVPPDMKALGVRVMWAKDGAPVLRAMTRPAAGQPFVEKWLALDPRTGRLSPLDKAPGLYTPPTDTPPLRLKSTTQTIKEGDTTRRVQPLWLEYAGKSEAPRALVCADAEGGWLSPRADAALYLSQGAAWVAPLARVPKAAFEEMRSQALRAMLMSNAKQLGLAMIMYAQDYDETLPTGDNINAKLEPYLKTDTLFQGFTYTYGGGPLKDIERPAETELGYVTGPGGRAVIFADGHVVWKGD